MPKVSEAHRAGRRDQILDAAIACFTGQGFQATTMADIIDASGLSAGAIYQYFSGKQELAVAAARRAIGGRVIDVAEAGADEPLSPSGILRAISDGFLRDGVSTGLVVQLWGEAASDPEFHALAVDAFGELARAFGAQLATWARVKHGMTAAEADAWARDTLPVILGLGQGLIVQSALMPAFDRERYLAGVAAVLG